MQSLKPITFRLVGDQEMSLNLHRKLNGPMSLLGQTRKCSLRADVFRCSPNNGHRSIGSACPFGANKRHRATTKGRVFSFAESSLLLKILTKCIY